MPPLDPFYGAWWLLAYVLIVVLALAVFAGVERHEGDDR